MSRKFKSQRKYNYNSGTNFKKIILIILIVILVAAAVIFAAISLLGNSDNTTGATSFTIQSVPDKITYHVGEVPSWFGLKLKLITAEGNSATFGPESCTITGFDSSAPAENQVITVKYNDYTATFTITIIDAGNDDFQPGGLFKSMSFKSTPKTEYKVNDWLSVKGGVLLLEYSDGTSKEIDLTYDMVYGFDTSKPGTYTITVTYMEDGHRATLTYDITVTN